MARRRHDVAVLGDAVVGVPLLAAAAVEDLAGDTFVLEHGFHLVGLTEVLGDEDDVQSVEVETVVAGVREVRAHAFVLPDRRDDDADILAHCPAVF